MRVVGFEKNFGMPERDPTIVMLGGIVDEPFGDRPRIVPNGATSAGVEGKGVVGGSDEHDAVNDYRRDLEASRVAYVEDPLCAEVGDIRRRDLGEIAEAAPGVIPIVRNPVRARGLNEQVLRADVDRSGNDGCRFFWCGGQPRAD